MLKRAYSAPCTSLIMLSVAGLMVAQAMSPFMPRTSGRASRLMSALHQSEPSGHIGIVGGGLAGLSTAFYLLQKAPNLSVTVLDREEPGAGGASSVAGGFLHPLSPRGKLVHLGLEGLLATNTLVDAASKFESDCVLRDEIYRVAVDDNHEKTLKDSALTLPDTTEWIGREELPWDPPADVRGALRLHSGCKVVHVPTYLQGLWKAIESKGTGHKEWIIADMDSNDGSWSDKLANFDTVVFAAGSGLFQNGLLDFKLPIQLVRGQSMEMTLNETSQEHAMLCGKYVSPLLDEGRVLIGATHEFQEEPLDIDGVTSELQQRSKSFVPHLWKDGTIDKITSAYRVQSNRGKFGRLPILGRIESQLRSDAWIFTGLSSRGLLLHGVYGEILASEILNVESQFAFSDVDWWRGKVEQGK